MEDGERREWDEEKLMNGIICIQQKDPARRYGHEGVSLASAVYCTELLFSHVSHLVILVQS